MIGVLQALDIEPGVTRAFDVHLGQRRVGLASATSEGIRAMRFAARIWRPQGVLRLDGTIGMLEDSIGRPVPLELDVEGDRAAWATGRLVRGAVFLEAILADGSGLSLAMRRAGDGSLTVIVDGVCRSELALVPVAALSELSPARVRRLSL